MKPSFALLLSLAFWLVESSFPFNSTSAQVTPPELQVIPPSTEHPEGMKEIVSEDTVIYLPNVEYAKYGDRRLKLNILMPVNQGEAPPRPLILYIKGGGWRRRNWNKLIPPQLAYFAHRDNRYVVAMVEHRHSMEAKAPAQVQDVKAAIRFMRANAEEYNIDPERIGIWGGSSGGHLASMIGTSDGVAEFLTEDNQSQPSSVKAVVNFYGPTDFTQMNKYPTQMDHDAEDSPESQVIGGPIQDPKYRELVQMYNPITYISKDKELPPFLIVHGDQDGKVPFNQSVLLYTALRDAGQDVTFYKIKGADHGKGVWTPRVLNLVYDFFEQHLNNGSDSRRLENNAARIRMLKRNNKGAKPQL
ncbi:alpha/beta hydrolase [Pleurocapsa sp. PCC 7319]|uniref:alpha/beta hydrolase n=1 Tax=Pleurocapsa sp. PCC 7319 TaxID=118161 RepID=UPI0003465C94|nr:alpha/beta hydrolase [Pleurocapsa sp. PCC 7319]